jgi:hypothetical protein
MARSATEFLDTLDPMVAMNLDLSMRAFGAGSVNAFNNNSPCCIIGHCFFIDGYDESTYDENYLAKSPTLDAVCRAMFDETGFDARCKLYMRNDQYIDSWSPHSSLQDWTDAMYLDNK